MIKVIKWISFSLLLVVGTVTVMHRFMVHQEHKKEEEEIVQKVNKLATDPKSRPDAWTATMDADRTRQMCSAILLIAPGRTDVLAALPEVCRHGQEE